MNEAAQANGPWKKYGFSLLMLAILIVPAVLALWTLSLTVTVEDLCGDQIPPALRSSLATVYRLSGTTSELSTTPEEIRRCGGILPDLLDAPPESFELKGYSFRTTDDHDDDLSSIMGTTRTYQSIGSHHDIVLILIETDDGKVAVVIFEKVGVQTWFD